MTTSGRHRDYGYTMPFEGRWIGLDGELMRNTSIVTRESMGLPPKTVQIGQTWEEGDE